MKTIVEAVADYFQDLKKGCNNLISCEQLKEVMKKEEVYILDIRKPEDYEEEHLEGAVNIFWSEVGDHLNEIPKDKKVIVCCYSGQSAGQVVSLMRLLGYNACSLKGGMKCDLTYLPLEARCCDIKTESCEA
ncbi:MAG: rhodanese-like domain-containing protein [Aminobacterium sp.]|uniref:rhodanese-like domain-containing protein n=1 Tax=Aminobacterium sp. MB27-C1 TaxID=3070661 RepID=UPI001BCCD839|nr:rhodanese-like domain-containing protein [Aminobacterium sp. MB27-C1]MDD2207592.1 rhodanese-like domain-containing protein [Aminobacterium sp.]MDD3708278.1 rhodanese-like domain-containing protein [Aminobacterium sp.]MDD4229580.1 rhodanese-like domain-containing protein [Aminobacterium sp.]MDD4552449.1 rhodanese-like domain-containing protein [Aminobacterium sp.]WMI71053.1 rhodanese-like domain-containing protein [Aminobacterium sp. MB27-C1]